MMESFKSRAAISAASLHTLAMSAPIKSKIKIKIIYTFFEFNILTVNIQQNSLIEVHINKNPITAF